MFSIIDIGTGSGCIIISLAKELSKNLLPNTQYLISYFASDISKKALYVARKNAKQYEVNDQINFFHSDLFANKKMPKKYDVIIANLPYVSEKRTRLDLDSSRSRKAKSEDLKSGIYFEPEQAIFASDNGTRIIKQFLNQAKNRINKNGIILIEVDPRNAYEVKKYAQKIFAQDNIELIKDLAGLDRVVKISIL